MASPITATPLPLYTAIPDVPADLSAAINNLEKFVVPRFATATARDTAIPAPIDGMLAYVNGVFQKNVGGTTGGWTALIPVVTVPDEVSSYTNSTTSIPSATTLTTTGCVATITNPSTTQALLCEVQYGGEIVAYGTATRLTTGATGSNTWTGNSSGPASGSPLDGPTGYAENFIEYQTGDASAIGRTASNAYSMRVPASGSTTITLYAWKGGAGTNNAVNNSRLRIIPIRYI